MVVEKIYKLAPKINLFTSISLILIALLTTLFVFRQNHSTTNLSKSTDEEKLLFSFTAVGDFGNNTTSKAVLAQSAKLKPDFMIALGDFSYNQGSGAAAWCKLVHSALGETFPFMLVAGNHDVEENRPNGAHLEKYTSCLPNRMPNMVGAYAQQYYFDYADKVRVVAIVPDLTIWEKSIDYSIGGEGYKWVESVIDSARAEGIEWVVMSMHKACITSGVKNCDIGEDIFNLMVEKKVDLILQAHEHGYMRSHQFQLNEQCEAVHEANFNKSCINASSDGSYTKNNGPIVMINGTGGFKPRGIDLKRPEINYFADWHGVGADLAHGPSLVKVYKDKLMVEFIDTNGISQDSFVITK